MCKKNFSPIPQVLPELQDFDHFEGGFRPPMGGFRKFFHNSKNAPSPTLQQPQQHHFDPSSHLRATAKRVVPGMAFRRESYSSNNSPQGRSQAQRFGAFPCRTHPLPCPKIQARSEMVAKNRTTAGRSSQIHALNIIGSTNLDWIKTIIIWTKQVKIRKC